MLVASVRIVPAYMRSRPLSWALSEHRRSYKSADQVPAVRETVGERLNQMEGVSVSWVYLYAFLKLTSNASFITDDTCFVLIFK